MSTMRTRLLRPGFFKNDDLGTLPPLTRILFAGLWCLADREGRLLDRPARIKIEVLPYDPCDVDSMLDHLAIHGFIQRYAQGELHLISIRAFAVHQRPHHKEEASILPAPPKHEPSMDQAYVMDEPSMDQASSEHDASMNQARADDEATIPPSVNASVNTSGDSRGDGESLAKTPRDHQHHGTPPLVVVPGPPDTCAFLGAIAEKPGMVPDDVMQHFTSAGNRLDGTAVDDAWLAECRQIRQTTSGGCDWEECRAGLGRAGERLARWAAKKNGHLLQNPRTALSHVLREERAAIILALADPARTTITTDDEE